MPRSHIRTALDAPREGLSPAHLQILSDIEQYGFHIMHVERALAAEHNHRLSQADEEWGQRWSSVPDWSYTIGLYQSYGHPEIVVFTLDEKIVPELFWDLARGIQEGRIFESGTIYGDALPRFEGQRCAFERVSAAWAPNLFGFASWFYQYSDFPVLQYLWPDRHGHFAWDPGAAEYLRDAQRALSTPPTEPDAPPLRR
jgi:hypothetical protein